ncbi:trehalose transporter 1-like protein isoform X2 [Rhodnius prolixus]
MSQGFSAVLIPQLQLPNSFIRVDSQDASWIASLGVISTPGGALVSGFMAETLGRKTTVQITALPFLLGCLLMALSSNKLWLYIGRFITGFAIGMGSTCYVYLAEISQPAERGMLASLGPVFVSFGVLLVYLFGYILDWHLVSVACAAIAAFSLIIIYFLPETPPWLAHKKKFEKAHRTLLTLRGSKESADKEMELIMQSINNKTNLTFLEYLSQLRQPGVWKPFIILILFFICQEGSGMYIIVYYATSIFNEIGSVFESSVESIIIGGVRLVTSAIGSICIQHFGRRPLAMGSGLGMGLSMGLAAWYEFEFGHLPPIDRPCPYVPLICVILNVIASMLGMLQLPWLMIGELFPLPVRGLMSGTVSSLAYLFIFTIIKVYPDMMTSLHLSGMMILFSAVSITTVLFVFLYLPETQGKSLLDIENSFKKKTDSNEDVLPEVIKSSP